MGLMTRLSEFDLSAAISRWSRGWRGPTLAAFIAMIAGLPGLMAMPPLDRDESRFTQATSQMLEQDDYVVIRYQEEPRFKKPVGIYWLQAASVSLLSSPEARQIWAYRIPSLLGAMMAAAACAWGAAAFFGDRAGLMAGSMLGAGFLLSTEAFIAKTDSVLAGVTTLAMGCLARLYAAENGGPEASRGVRALFWIAVAAGTLVKGPITPMVAGLTLVALWSWDRKASWIARLGWGWGLIIFLAIIGPWAWAVTVATDGAFWNAAIAGDLAPKLAGRQESHGGPPGYHALAALIQTFPAVLLLPGALAIGWRYRKEPGVRFALCWLVPAWLVFEITPTKLSHYALPCYGALAWLSALAVTRPMGAIVRWAGAGLQALIGILLAMGVVYLGRLYGDPGDIVYVAAAALLLGAAGLAGGWLLLRGKTLKALGAALPLGLLGHAVLVGGLAPHLEPLLLSTRTEAMLASAHLLPRQGVYPGPVAVAGYAEPSLVFAIGTRTQLGDAEDAVTALSENRPAVVEARQKAGFEALVRAARLSPRKIGEVKGLDYSNGDDMTLTVYGPQQETAP